MGSGQKPPKATNKKKTSSLLEAGQASGAAIAGADNFDTKMCILDFTASLVLNAKANEVAAGDEVILIPREEKDKLDIMIGPKSYGVYTAQYAPVMWQCSNAGYEYRGKIDAVSSAVGEVLQAKCGIKAHVRE